MVLPLFGLSLRASLIIDVAIAAYKHRTTTTSTPTGKTN
jgi:hypothetical protein